MPEGIDAGNLYLYSGDDRIWVPEGRFFITSTPTHRLVTFARQVAEGQFVASVTFATRNGKPAIWGVTVRPTDELNELPPYGLTVRNVRDAITALLEEARTKLAASGMIEPLRSPHRRGPMSC